VSQRVAVGLIDLRGKAVEGGIMWSMMLAPPPTRDDFAVLHATIIASSSSISALSHSV